MLPIYLKGDQSQSVSIEIKKNQISCNTKTIKIKKVMLKHKLLKFFLRKGNHYIPKSLIVKHLYKINNLSKRSEIQQNAYFQASRKQLERARRFMEEHFNDVTDQKLNWFVYNRKINAWKLFEEKDT